MPSFDRIDRISEEVRHNIDKIIREIDELGVRYIFPVHCTGMNAIIRFKMQLGDKVQIATAGDEYEI